MIRAAPDARISSDFSAGVSWLDFAKIPCRFEQALQREELFAMGAKKKQVSAFVDPPGPLAPIEDWIEHRRELDRLEAELRVSHPDLAWSDELQSLKAEADAAIEALTP
jgi:hypothetical protein